MCVVPLLPRNRECKTRQPRQSIGVTAFKFEILYTYTFFDTNCVHYAVIAAFNREAHYLQHFLRLTSDRVAIFNCLLD